MKNIEKIVATRPLVSVQDIISFIKKGEEYKIKIVNGIAQGNEIEFLNAIILSPDYQRHYRSNDSEGSSIIESLILGIPIPEVFLVKTSSDINLRQVMDGQHRLTAIYKYTNNDFALRNLEILDRDDDGNLVDSPKYEGKKFSDLNTEDKVKILSSSLSILQFEAFADKQLEIELFKRYNKNTKPLEAQEIAMATYFSRTSQLISLFIDDISFSKGKEYDIDRFSYNEDTLKILGDIYNTTINRKQRQKIHQEICIILNILEEGPNPILNDGVKIATDYLKRKSEIEVEADIQKTQEKLIYYNKLLLTLRNNFSIRYPLSSELTNKNSDVISPKFQVGISIILSLICYFFDIQFDSDSLLDEIRMIISKSPIGDETYKASSTNLKTMIRYLFKDNKIHESRELQSLRFKTNLSTHLNKLISKN